MTASQIKRRAASLFGVTLISLFLTGCAGYRLGSMLPGDIASVHIPTFINQTTEPLIEIDTTQAVIQRFQQDGSLAVVGEATADAILVVTLTDYRLEPVVFRKDRRTAAQEYRVHIIANMVMRRTSDQSVVVEQSGIFGDHVFEVFGDLSSSKLTANPSAAESLARRIVERVVEYW